MEMETHKQKFYSHLDKISHRKGKTASSYVTKETYSTILFRLQELGEKKVKKSIEDYNLLRRYGIFQINHGAEKIERLVKTGTQYFIACFEVRIFILF
jgi:hypothetical protein